MTLSEEEGVGATHGDEFSASWLALREPVDHRARSSALDSRLRDYWQLRGWSRILDLGSGTGSNLRYLAARLPRPQKWTLLDRDAALLKLAVAPAPNVTLQTVVGGLDTVGLKEVQNAQLVTASALLDLVSEEWLRRVISACRAAACGVLLALTYDGQIRWTRASGLGETDVEPYDEVVRKAVNAHQKRDKGLGPALGPDAGRGAAGRFREAGYDVCEAPSPWHLDDDDGALASDLMSGWADAAAEEQPAQSVQIRAWARRRRADLEAGRVRLEVGHRDLLALPVQH